MIQKRFRIGTVTEAYELAIITVIIPAILITLAVAATVELIWTPVLI